MYDYVLFDLDGTLTDSAEGVINSVLYALKKKGIEEQDRDKLYAFVGPPLADSFMKHYGMSEEEAQEMIYVYREYYEPKGWAENSVYEGMQEVLSELCARGKHLLVATSKPEKFAKKILEHFDLAQYFELICGASMDEKISRKDQVIACVIEKIGAEHLKEMVMVGDRKYDVIGARQNGLPCIGVLYGYGDRKELEAAGAAAICPTVRELPEYL